MVPRRIAIARAMVRPMPIPTSRTERPKRTVPTPQQSEKTIMRTREEVGVEGGERTLKRSEKGMTNEV